ncbi:MAG: LacI family transcriptional regulator [Firmicutes bacterium]|nr:LacI family transcriptional regulator [Bacillota bacterium]
MKDLARNRSATIQDIARIAGVSPATVSLVLNNRPGIAEETRQKVLEVAKELNYKRRATRRNGNDGNLLALVMEELPMPVFTDSFCGTIISGINQAAQDAGYHVVLAIVKPGRGADRQIPPIIASGEAAGAIILGGGDLDDEFLIRVAEEANSAVVLVDNYVYGHTFPCVLANNVEAGFLATQHLLSLGHTRIGFIQGSSKYKPLNERLLGYFLALRQASIDFSPELLPPRMSHGSEKGRKEMEALLKLREPPTAVVCASDQTAFNAVDVIKQAGLTIPENISIVGIDDITEAAIQDPPLTTVHIPKREMGIAAVNLLLSYKSSKTSIECGLQLVMGTQLVVRESTSSPGQRP